MILFDFEDFLFRTKEEDLQKQVSFNSVPQYLQQCSDFHKIETGDYFDIQILGYFILRIPEYITLRGKLLNLIFSVA